MSEKTVSMIGMGALGSTIARTLAGGGIDLVIWNRTEAKAGPVVDAGARLANSAAEAAQAGETLLICVNDAAAVDALLDLEGVLEALHDKAVVNITTMSGDEALSLESRLSRAGARFLQAGVNAYPRDIGGSETSVLYAGDETLFLELEEILKVIGGAPTYVSNDVASVSVLYMALWSYYFTAVVGLLEAATVAQNAGLDISKFVDIVDSVMLPQIRGASADAVTRLENNQLGPDQGRLANTASTIAAYAASTSELGVGSRFITASAEYLDEAVSAGFGQMNLAALFKCMTGEKP